MTTPQPPTPGIPGVPGDVVSLPGWQTHHEIGDVTGGPIDPFEWHKAAPALKKLFIKAWIAKACQAEGVDPAIWGPPYETLVAHESGGYTGGVADPNIVNLYDTNAKAGIPSLGIAQVIQPNAPGENLLDPVVNIRASIRHVKEAFSNGKNPPGSLGRNVPPELAITNVQQGDPTKPPSGYDTGGPVGPSGSATFPLFTDEGPEYYGAAYAHNRPFATPGPYRTPLSGADERAYRRWVQSNHIPTDPDEDPSDYDMRGYWQENHPTGKPAFFTDTYKTPYDTTFSGLSRYATPDCPFVWKDGATLIDRRDGSVVFFNPSHYASEEPKPMETAPFAPPDMPASHYGSRWEFGVRHADGSITKVPLQLRSQGGGETHWDAEIDRLRPGEELVVIEKGR